MRSVKGIGKITVAIILVVIVAAAAVSSYYFLLPKKEARVVRIAVLKIVDELPEWVAIEKGYFLEEGLNVTVRAVASGAVSGPAIQAGSLDVGISAVHPAAQMRERGLDFVFFAPAASITYPPGWKPFTYDPNYSNHGMIVRADSDIKTWKDLEGKRVAVNALGGITQTYVMNAMVNHGADHKKVQWVAFPPPELVPALAAGRVDAIDIWEPFVTSARAQPEKFRIIGDPQSEKSQVVSGWFTTRDWLNNNMDTAKAWNRARAKAIDFIKANEKDAREILTKATGLPAELASKIVLYEYPKAGPIDREMVRYQLDVTLKYGTLGKEITVDELFAPEFFKVR